jgi:ACS family hexuronate transporter-like MFS transporter
MINYMDRQTLSLTITYVYDQFGKDPALYGFTETCFSVAFALGALLVGWLADRWNIFWIYPATVTLWSVAGFATGFAEGWLGLMVCRFFLGLAEAGHWPCALRTTQHLLPPDQRSMGNGILQSGAAIGALITPFVVVALVQQSEQWRRPFWVVGGLGLSWVALWLLWVRPRDLPTFRPQKRSANGAFPDKDESPPYAFLRDRRFWVLVVVVISINIAWHYFRAWLTQVMDASGYSRDESIMFNSAYYIAADAGSLSVGFATLFLGRRGVSVYSARVWMFAGCTLLTLLGVVVAFLAQGVLFLILLLVIAFGSLGLFPIYYSFSQDITVRHQGKVNGTLGFLNWMAVAGLQALIGLLVKWTGSHAVGMVICSLAPVAGLAALLVFWRRPGVGRARNDKSEKSEADRASAKR